MTLIDEIPDGVTLSNFKIAGPKGYKMKVVESHHILSKKEINKDIEKHLKGKSFVIKGKKKLIVVLKESSDKFRVLKPGKSLKIEYDLKHMKNKDFVAKKPKIRYQFRD